MKIFNKVLVVLFILIILAGAVASLFYIWHSEFTKFVNFLLLSIRKDTLDKILFTLISLLFVFLSCEILFYGLSGDKTRSIVIKSTANGEIRVAISSIEQMALKIIRSIEGVRDARVTAKGMKDTVGFKVIIALVPNTPIPQVTENLQTALKTGVEEAISFPVDNIQVYVDNSIVKNK
ncbi:MAG TPA: alkaline shock response membrane anchor protein AmaP [Clostridia bacterium]|nr:alkaline shock response membrane anchor protein AmaP [Clostridia bacterium]